MDPKAVDRLEASICSVGYWRTWAADLPQWIEFDFGGVRLADFFSTTLPRPVRSLRLRFTGPRSVVFVASSNMMVMSLVGGADLDPSGADAFWTQAPDTEDWRLRPDWPLRLQNGEIRAQGITYDAFTFDDLRVANKILDDAEWMQKLFGEGPDLNRWRNAPARLCFWAGSVGAVISADAMQLLDDERPIDLDDVESMGHAWFRYWKQYWQRRGKSDALPVDYACEVTHPGVDALK